MAFLLSWIQADLNNPIVVYINRATIPMWNWVGSKLPRNLAAFAPIFALMLIIFGEIVLPGVIRSLGASFTGNLDLNDGLINVALYVLFGGLKITASIFGFILLLAVLWFIFTLVNPPLNNPFIRAIWFLVDPLLSPIQRLLPRARIDLSPLVLAIIALLLQEAISRIMIPVQAGLLI